MDDMDLLTERFEASRPRLRAVAYRMLGSNTEADDAVQEAWLRVDRADPSGVENLGGWLTTIVARICLDRLRSRRSRPEDPVGALPPEPIVGIDDDSDPSHDVLMADAVGPALLVVLDLLAPAERVTFVLHDIFAVPFDEIGQIVGRSPDAARQLASRARRRVHGTSALPESDLIRQREIVAAFLAAAHDGDFNALLTLLDPDVVFRADAAARRTGAPSEAHGAAEVAANFSGRAQGAQPAFVDAVAGLVWAPGGQPRGVFNFTIAEGKVIEIRLIAEPERIRQLDIVLLDR